MLIGTELLLSEVTKWLWLLVFLILIYELFKGLSQQSKKEHQQAFGNRRPQPQQNSWQQNPTPYQSRKLERLRQILTEDPELADEICELVGISQGQKDQLLTDPKLIRQIESQLSEDVINILEVATRKAAIDLDLDSQKLRLKRSKVPGIYQEPGRMKDPSQIKHLHPSEFANPKNIRKHRIATGQAKTMHHFNFVPEIIVLYVLEDWSGSMTQNAMADGLPRYIWARGVIYKLAKQAIRGKSKFVHRGFDTSPLQPFFVTNISDAHAFLSYITSTPPSEGGTNIFAALKKAVEDINSKKIATGIAKAEILLITDGEDSSLPDNTELNKLLAGKIRLNVIAIGGSNQRLKKVAATYQEFS